MADEGIALTSAPSPETVALPLPSFCIEVQYKIHLKKMVSLLKTLPPSFVSFINEVMIDSIAFLQFGISQVPKIEGTFKIG